MYANYYGTTPHLLKGAFNLSSNDACYHLIVQFITIYKNGGKYMYMHTLITTRISEEDIM